MSACEHCGQPHEATHTFCPNTGKLIPSRLLPEGTLLEGKYRIGRTLGIGGMGAVFEAQHTLLDKRVAIKVMLPDCDPAMAEQMAARMVREARAASATGHRNITQVTDMGNVRRGSLFVVMEYLDGRTLKDLLEQEGSFEVQRAAQLMTQVLAGLFVVHRKSIVHRDLKPDNLMVIVDDEGEEVVKILDFGISKIVKGESKLNLTSTGLVMGTPQYMSPEQAKSAAEIDHRTDIYSAGAILYHMVTGTLPHRQETLNALIAAVLTSPVDPPSKRHPGLPAALDVVLLKALAREPDQRYQDAREFRDALRPFEQATAAAPAPPPTPPTTPQQAPGAYAASFDALQLVALDEAAEPSAAPLAPAPKPPPTSTDETLPPQPVALDERDSAGDDHLFKPPDTEEESLELETHEPEVARPRAATPPPSESSRGDVTGEHPLDRLHSATGPYGQARKQAPARLGMLVALGLVAVGGLLVWLIFLRGDDAQQQQVKLDAADYVEIRFDVTPKFARVKVDGVELTSNPLTLQRSSRQHMVTVRATGYWSQTVSFTPDESRSFKIELKERQKRE
jgi:serine/threonine-protein kinase